MSEAIRYEFAFGTYEDALEMVGVQTEPRYAGTAVSGARIQHFAALIHDPNPAYWDVDFAREVWGGLLAPPALLMGWLIPPPWLPTGEPPRPSIAIRVPLPGTTFINASNDVEFPATIVEGDRLHVIEEVVCVAGEDDARRYGTFRRDLRPIPPRRRHIGRHQSKHVVPLHPGGETVTGFRRCSWDDIVVPTELEEVVDTLDYQRVVMNPGATWDYFPGHFDPEYAQRHGHPTIFVNTMHTAGFVDRIATGWAGPYSRVVRRKVSLLGSLYAGDSMVGRGRVVDKRVESTGDVQRRLVDLEIGVYNQRDELCCPAEVTLEIR